MKLSAHFTEAEFACRHCGKLGRRGINPSLLAQLEHLRFALGNHPVKVVSGYRCVRHNKDVGGARLSYHVKGMAADIQVATKTVDEIKDAARKIFTGVIPYHRPSGGWVHVDVRPRKYHPEEG